MNTREATEIIDRKEAAKALGVSLTQIERFRKGGRLPYIKLAHRCVRYRRSDCEKLLQACTVIEKEWAKTNTKKGKGK